MLRSDGGRTRKRRKLRTPVGAEGGLHRIACWSVGLQSRGVSCRCPVACVQCVESGALGELLFYFFAPPIKKGKCFGVCFAAMQRWRYGTPGPGTPFSEHMGAPASAGAPGSPGAENGRDQRERQTHRLQDHLDARKLLIKITAKRNIARLAQGAFGEGTAAKIRS